MFLVQNHLQVPGYLFCRIYKYPKQA